MDGNGGPGRAEVEGLIEEGPSLRARLCVLLPRLLPRANPAAARVVGVELEARRGSGPAEARAPGALELTSDQVLGDWFPDRPRAAAAARP